MDGEGAGGRRLLAVVLGSVALAVVVGGLVGFVGYAGSDSESGGEFEELGRAIIGLIAAVVVGGAVFVGSLVVGVRRTVPAGRRLQTVVTIVLAMAAAGLLLGWVTEASSRAGLHVLSPFAGLLVIGAGAAVVGGAAAVVPGRRVAVLAGATVVVLVSFAVAANLRADDVADQQRVERYESNGAPLALINGSDLDAGFVGWELLLVDNGHASGEVAATYDIVDVPEVGYGRVQLVFEVAVGPLDCGNDTCEEVGRGPDGQPVFRRRVGGSDGQGGFADVWVDVEGGRWRVAGGAFDEVDPDAAVAVLQALEPVDAEAFVAGT
jgi:hypothetical protein